MLNIKSLITAVALVSSTVAAASSADAATVVREHGRVETVVRTPVREPVRFERGHGPVVVNRWGRDRFIDHPIVVRRPIVVERREWARPVIRERFYNYVPAPFATGSFAITLDSQACQGVELGTLGGVTAVNQVAVNYTDGRQELVNVNQTIDAQNPRVDLTTDGTPIASVVIYGQGAGVSAAAY